jgi:hypothetical protein
VQSPGGFEMHAPLTGGPAATRYRSVDRLEPSASEEHMGSSITHEIHATSSDGVTRISLLRHRRLNDEFAAHVNRRLREWGAQLVRNPRGSGWVLTGGDQMSVVDSNTNACHRYELSFSVTRATVQLRSRSS